MQACTDRAVQLDAAAQKTVLRLSKRHPSLRAALARLEHLDGEVRAALLSDTDADVRRAVLERTDLTREERTVLLRGERRVTVLQAAAENTTDPEELATLATKGGKKLALTVATNPATPHDARLAAATTVIESAGSYSYRETPKLRMLLATFPAAAAKVLEKPANPLFGTALELLPMLDVDRTAVLERLLVSLEAQLSTRVADIPEALRYVVWMLTDDQRERLEAMWRTVSDPSTGHVNYQYSGWSRLGRILQDPPAQMEAICTRFLTDLEELDAGRPVTLLSGLTGMPSMMSMVVALRTLQEDIGSVAHVVDSLRAVYGGFGFSDAMAPLCTTSRQRLAVLGARTLTEDGLSRLLGRDLAGVVEVAAAEGFWPPELIELMLRSDAVALETLAEVPLASLPAELPSRALTPLLDRLGRRVSDPEWLDVAVALSDSWQGSVADLVDLTDQV